jgi:hypothetical protein
LAAQLHYSGVAKKLGGVPMSALADAEFLRLLKKDIDYFERTVELFEDLIPRLSAPVQDQWRLQAQSRRNYALELMILLEKAEQFAGSVLTNGAMTNGRDH